MFQARLIARIEIVNRIDGDDLNVGTSLLRELIDDQGYNTILHASFSTKNFTRMSTSKQEANVYIDPKNVIQLPTADSYEGTVYQDTPVKIAIAHELIHAQRHMNGTFIVPTADNDITYSYLDSITKISGRAQLNFTQKTIHREEYYTTGLHLPPWELANYTQHGYTENAIRQEHGIPLRSMYE